MLNDLDVIVKKYPAAWSKLRLYAIGDVHVGSENFNERAIRKKIDIIKNDEFGVVSICGDLADFGLKNSVSNVYHQTLSPKQQQEYVYELFKPIADKIVSLVPGNHEARITREVGLCPLYDIAVRWGIEDVYRENVAILKLLFGSQKGDAQQNCFIGITTHGSSKNKHHRFVASFDSIDWSISGHSHQPSYTPYGKIRVDAINAKAKHTVYYDLVVDANLMPGGYGIKKEYEIPPPPELQYLELSTRRDGDRKRTIHKVIDYHAITI